jgi:transketolase
MTVKQLLGEKLALRDAYGKTLVKLGRENPDIVVLDADLSGSTRTSMFAKEFPQRFFNVGVAEANLIGMAAGFACAGKTPFASTFAIFLTGKPWEQIRQSVSHTNLNVKLVSSHGGLTVGEDGSSHQSLEDLAIMRVLPNMRIIVPADAFETAAAVEWAAKNQGPVYIRLSREKFSTLFSPAHSFEIGRASLLSEGRDAAVIACGLMTSMALRAAEKLEAEGISITVINMSSIKPLDEELLLKAARATGAVVTAEEHSVIGGLGGAVAEFLGENYPVPVVKVGVQDKFGTSGKPEELLERYGLTEKHIILAVKKALKMNKGKG